MQLGSAKILSTKWYAEQDSKTDETIIYANFREKIRTRKNVEIKCVVNASSFQNRSKLYYCQRLYHLQGRNHLGTAGSISGRYDHTLEQGMDHRGLRYFQQQMCRYFRR